MFIWLKPKDEVSEAETEQGLRALLLDEVCSQVAGVSTAGVTLCSGNIALKMAPPGRATSFLAANAIVNGAAATIAPILAGLAADFFVNERLTLWLRWLNTVTSTTRFDLAAFDLIGLDYLFVFAAIFGLYAMHRLLAVREEGEVENGVMLSEFYYKVRKAVRHLSNVAGLCHLYTFPYARIEEPDKPSNTTIDAASPSHDNDG